MLIETLLTLHTSNKFLKWTSAPYLLYGGAMFTLEALFFGVNPFCAV